MVLDYDQYFDNDCWRAAPYGSGQLDEILSWCTANKIKTQIAYDKIWFNSTRDYVLYTLRWL